jgi:hypothetical protein
MINSVQTTQQSNSSINTSPILQSDITHFENKSHRLETETTPIQVENTNPTVILPSLTDNTDNAQTPTPPGDDFPTPTLPCCHLSLSPTLQHATIKTTPIFDTLNYTTPAITTKHPDKIINNTTSVVPLSNSRSPNIDANIKSPKMLSVQTDFTVQKLIPNTVSLFNNQIILFQITQQNSV